ncbi:hypothetical protein PG997_010678 [Apiospora hydei]|uniref:Uncharacterized protein n=1 Tax=Apiospora hydei TaxID=1337664 RepID=A0ABR1VJT5_9PEZI
MTLPVVPDIPVGKTEPVPKGGAVVLAVGKGAWPELRIGDPVVCVPVPRVTLLPGGMPCPVGPMLPVAFEIGNGAELGSVLVGPPASPLLPVGAIVDIAVVAAEPVPRGLVGFEAPVEFESGNGASDGLLCNGWVGLEPALGPAVGPVEFDMVKGGTAVDPIVPEAVFPTPLEPGTATLEFEIGNGGTVCPAGLLPGALIPDARDVVRLGADGAVVSPDPPVGPALGAVVFDRGNGGFDSEEVLSGVSGTEAPVLNGAVPEIPPVGAIVWPSGPPVVLVIGKGAVENVFPSDNEDVVARTLEFEANVEPPNVAVVFPVGKGGVVGDDPVPGGKLLKAVLEMARPVEVEELNNPDVSVPTGDIVKDPEATAVVPLEDGINGAVPVGAVRTVVLDNGNGGATVEVAISLPLPVALGELTPGAVGLPCPTGPDDGAPEAGLVVEPTTPLAEGETGTVPVGPTVTVVLKVGNGANVIVDSAELGEGTMFDPELAVGPVSDVLLGLVKGNGGDTPDPDSGVVTGSGETEPVNVPAVAVTENVVVVDVYPCPVGPVPAELDVILPAGKGALLVVKDVNPAEFEEEPSLDDVLKEMVGAVCPWAVVAPDEGAAGPVVEFIQLDCDAGKLDDT